MIRKLYFIGFVLMTIITTVSTTLYTVNYNKLKSIEENNLDFDYNINVLKNSIDIRESTIAGTCSMYPQWQEDDMLYSIWLNESDEPKMGEIYSYKKGELNVAHRLIQIYDINGENIYVFKGDNKAIADDPVKREQIQAEVIAQCFRDYCSKWWVDD